MTNDELLEEGFSIVEPLFVRRPFIWPESRAKAELDEIEGFLEGELPSKEKCRAIWQMITSAQPPHPEKKHT